MGGPGPRSKLGNAFNRRFGDARVGRQAQIIVTAEGQILTAIDPDTHTLPGFQGAATPSQSLLFQSGKFGNKVAHCRVGSRFNARTKHRKLQSLPAPCSRLAMGLMPSLPNSTLSRSATGFGVVSNFSP